MGIAFHLCERVLVIAEQQCYFACGPANLIDEIRDERISQCRLKENRDEVVPHTNSPGSKTRSSGVADMLMQTTCLQHMALLFSGVGSGVETQCMRVNERDGGDDVVKGLSTKLLNASRLNFGSAENEALQWIPTSKNAIMSQP